MVEQIQAFQAIGADYFMVEVLNYADDATRAMVVEEVLPKVKG